MAGPCRCRFTLPISVQKRPRAARIAGRSVSADIETALPTLWRPCFIWIVAMRGSAAPASRDLKVVSTSFVTRGHALEYQGRSCKLAELPGEDRRPFVTPSALSRARACPGPMWWSITIRKFQGTLVLLGSAVQSSAIYQFAR